MRRRHLSAQHGAPVDALARVAVPKAMRRQMQTPRAWRTRWRRCKMSEQLRSVDLGAVRAELRARSAIEVVDTVKFLLKCSLGAS